MEELTKLLGDDYRIFRLDEIGRVKYTNFAGSPSTFIDIIKFDERAKAAKLFMDAYLNGSSEGRLLVEGEEGYEIYKFRFVKNDEGIIAIGKKIEERTPSFTTDFMGNILSTSPEWAALNNKNIFDEVENRENLFRIIKNAIEYGEYEGKANINGSEKKVIIRAGSEIEFYIEEDISELISHILSSSNKNEILKTTAELLNNLGYKKYYIKLGEESEGEELPVEGITIPINGGVIKIYDGERREILSVLQSILNFSVSDRFRDGLIKSKFAMYAVNDEGVITYVNDNFKKLIGYGKEIMGRNVSEFCKEHEKGMKDGIFRWKTPFSEIYAKEYVIRTEGITYSIMFDVTEEVEAMKEAEFYNSLLRHDIYNKNQIAMGYLGLLKKTNTTKKQKELLEKITKAIDEGNKLIESVRKMEEIKSNRRIRKVRIGNIIRNICSSMEELAERNGIEIECGNINSTVIADDFVGEVFMNIIKNAIEHSGGNHIKIYGIDGENAYSVVVEDDGKGMEKDEIKKIFDEGWKKDSKGSGIGLYIVKKLIQRYGGKIEVESEIDRGCKFIITFRKSKGKEDFLRIRF